MQVANELAEVYRTLVLLQFGPYFMKSLPGTEHYQHYLHSGDGHA